MWVSLERQQTVLRMYYHLPVILRKASIMLRRLRRICDRDENFDIRSYEYKIYLIARDYKPTLVKRQFYAIKNISSCEARQVKPKVIKSNFNLSLCIIL